MGEGKVYSSSSATSSSCTSREDDHVKNGRAICSGIGRNRNAELLVSQPVINKQQRGSSVPEKHEKLEHVNCIPLK